MAASLRHGNLNRTVVTTSAAIAEDLVPATVPLAELLSTCSDACARACSEICAVQSRREAAGGALAVSRKDADDPRSALTEADVAAQAAILGALRAEWPGLHIIGEEEENEEEETAKSIGTALPPLRRDLCSSLSEPSQQLMVCLENVVVFVDPLDGTREFVEGRLASVQCLVGIAVQGRAIAGAVGLPFPSGKVDSEPSVIYGLVGGGVGTIGGGRRAGVAATDGYVSPRVATGDSSHPALAAGKAAAMGGGGSNPVYGGAGNKILAAAFGEVDVALMHTYGGPWDTCAPEAVLTAMGGCITDLFGAPLAYWPYITGSGRGTQNLGFLATCPDSAAPPHLAICAQLRADPTVLQQLRPWIGEGTLGLGTPPAAALPQQGGAVDIARNLNGAPLDVEELASQLGQSPGSARLVGYSACEAGAVRGMMSDACRLLLAWDADPEINGSRTPAAPPRSVFFKRVEPARRGARYAAAPDKLARDVKSYEVEAAWLGSAACAGLIGAGVHVPRAFSIDTRRSPEAPLHAAFSMLLEDFAEEDGWQQAGLLGEAEAEETLSLLARMHAYFWAGSDFWQSDAGAAGKDLEAAVWPCGAYWQPSMQPSEQMSEVAHSWTAHLASFADAFAAAPELAQVDLASLGERLELVAEEVAAQAHPFDQRYSTSELADSQRTMIHGDPKAANVFFRPTDAEGGCEVGLIDFQWTGFGLAATDVAHHLCAALKPECLSCDGRLEAGLLDHYYAKLSAGLAEFGVVESAEEASSSVISREELQAQYEAAVLDMGRLVIAYQWNRVKASPANLHKNRDSLGRNSYNKSLSNAIWLVARCDALLNAREKGL
ncbi:hypothetical protein CYMTET_41330 [Cymbomonas tetramitiformis]|uniref:3'(2'),5'-bisphosphate nucleotidase 1 n=1 Tax=Cymbomonas tetramitiformis TaxID=36881 RepID=A0AAE0F2M7_9CHLO|nr:hypothetical protein CYMTET_41330 [Cymbomonas tetramitiformis]